MQDDMTITRAKLERFVKIRNASPFNSNFQFLVDAEEAGFDPQDLGPAGITDDASGWYWETPHGQLIEHGNGKCELRPRQHVRRTGECTPDEKAAIDRYLASAHPSNRPRNMGAARWLFSRDKSGQLIAGLFLGGL